MRDNSHEEPWIKNPTRKQTAALKKLGEEKFTLTVGEFRQRLHEIMEIEGDDISGFVQVNRPDGTACPDDMMMKDALAALAHKHN